MSDFDYSTACRGHVKDKVRKREQGVIKYTNPTGRSLRCLNPKWANNGPMIYCSVGAERMHRHLRELGPSGRTLSTHLPANYWQIQD